MWIHEIEQTVLGLDVGYVGSESHQHMLCFVSFFSSNCKLQLVIALRIALRMHRSMNLTSFLHTNSN